MSVEAPPRGAGSSHSAVQIGVGQPEQGSRPPALLLPPEPLVRGRRVARLNRRRRRRRLLALVLVVALIAGGVGAWLKLAPHGSGSSVLPPAAFGPSPPSVAWALSWGVPDSGASLAIVGVPPGTGSIAVVAADEAAVDLPNGAPTTVAPSVTDVATAIETSQALMNRRVGHALVSTPQDIEALVDRLGPITFGAQGSAIVAGTAVGPGQTTANGTQVAGYLVDGTGVDPWVRWEDVLSGILDAPAKSSAWSPMPGATDDAAIVAGLMVDAHGAQVVDLPTTHEFGLLKVDTAGVASLVQSQFTTSVGGLVRVIVQNGNGRPGMGARIGATLAPYGYRVIDSQNAGSFDVSQTQVLASRESYLHWAQEAQRLLGVGSVYLDAQPTGIADITIVVGKDFGAG